MQEFLQKFGNVHILVVGDIMLDKYVRGRVERVSPEAPVPVLLHNKTEYFPGGAGNVALNIASLGARATLIGVVGYDLSGKQLLQSLSKKNLDTTYVIRDETYPTCTKERFVADGNQLLRTDYETTESISGATEAQIKQQVEQLLPTVDAVLIPDYGKGVITSSLARFIIDEAHKQNCVVIADTKPANKDNFRGVDLITPNMKEARQITGKEAIEDIGPLLVQEFQSNVLVTRSADGMTLFTKEGLMHHVPGLPTILHDVSGAGDTVAAVVSVMLAVGASLQEATELGNISGNLVVQKPGTSTLSIEELESAFAKPISDLIKESIDVKKALIASQQHQIEEFAHTVVQAYTSGKKIIAFGNGGSSCDAQHLVAELVGRFKKERKSLRALSLNAETATMTAIANDYGYERVFERQVSAHAEPGDVVVGISTSGHSPNVINAMKKARELGATTIGLTGKDGGQLPELCDLCLIAPSANTPRIQEAHILIIHIVCELMEKEYFKESEQSVY